MTPELKAAVKSACVQAVKSLGDNYKGMSCLLFNWRLQAAESSAGANKAA